MDIDPIEPEPVTLNVESIHDYDSQDQAFCRESCQLVDPLEVVLYSDLRDLLTVKYRGREGLWLLAFLCLDVYKVF